MIKHLKRRFIFVNMTILSCMLIGILASIFIMMYSSEINISNEVMESIISQNRMGKDGPKPFEKENLFNERDDNHPAEPDPFKGKVKRSCIYVEFKDINDITKIVYQYCNTEDDEAVKKAVETVYQEKDERGTITVGGEDYRYFLRYDPPKDNYSVVFLDRTPETDTINQLLFIMIIIMSAGLVLIFFISLLLAKWTVKPVERAWTQQKEFVANASHELKTPLTVIATNTDVVLSSPDDTVKSQGKWLNYIKDETARMSKLVNSLLCIAKYDANKAEIIHSTIDLSNLLESIVLQYEPLVFESGKLLCTDIDKGLKISGDVDKIKQLVNILLDNALKYSTDKGTIMISLKSPKSSLVSMTIANSSEEIPKNKLDKLFDRFYRIDGSRNRKTGGSGLGLNIAKTIVECHSGTIIAANNNGITEFTVTFNV